MLHLYKNFFDPACFFPQVYMNILVLLYDVFVKISMKICKRDADFVEFNLFFDRFT